MGASLGPVLQDMAGGSGGPAVLLSPAQEHLTVVKGQGFQAYVGSQSRPRTESGGHCDPSVPPGAGGKDVRVCGVAAVLPRELFFQGTGAVCTPSGWTWALPVTLSRWGALTEVGELHSLTDWQVSEASEDAELEDFCHEEASRQGGEAGGEERTELVTGPACGGCSDSAAPPPSRAIAVSVCSRTQHPDSTRLALTYPIARPTDHTF